jgi:hypothetical protein
MLFQPHARRIIPWLMEPSSGLTTKKGLGSSPRIVVRMSSSTTRRLTRRASSRSLKAMKSSGRSQGVRGLHHNRLQARPQLEEFAQQR